MCFAPDCNHTFDSCGCKNFRFPTDIHERKKWIKAVRRYDKQPCESDRICSCHFVDGKKENGPTIFSWNATIVAPKKKHKKLKKKKYVRKSTLIARAIKANKTKSNDEVIPVLGDDSLQTQISDLRKEIEKLKKHPFGFHSVENDEKLLLYYTGLTRDAFDAVLDSCSKSTFRYFLGLTVEDFDLKNQLLITLMKLRLNLDYFDLAVRFNTFEDTINNVVLTFVNVLHEIWFVGKMNEISYEESTKPDRMIVGFTEIDTVIPEQTDETEKPSKKPKNTLKGMVAIDPNGVITHCSMLYPKSTQDKVIMRRSGMATKFQDVKLTMIDEGTVSEVDSEVHAETVRRLRCFGVLNFIPKPLFTYSSKVFQVCGALANLVNFQSKLIELSNLSDTKEESDHFKSCTKTEFEEEEVNLEMEAVVFANDLDAVSCKSEPQSESEVEFVMEEFDVDLGEDI